jgi:lysozyme family protein
MASFDIAVKLVLDHEGGYTKGLPGDPGGETNFGVSKRAYPDLDIKNLTQERAIEIYKKDYWKDWMDVPEQSLGNCLLDCAVNQGVVTAAQLAQASKDLRDFQLHRLLRYVAIGKPQFYKSWFRRVLDC